MKQAYITPGENLLVVFRWCAAAALTTWSAGRPNAETRFVEPKFRGLTAWSSAW